MKNTKPGQTLRLDWYTIAKDFIKEWSVIVMISIAAVLFSYTFQYLHYSPTYTMTTTFTVNSRVAVTDVYSNLSTPYSTADTFAKVLDSSLMEKKVAQDIGYNYMPGTAKVNVIQDTNLLELTVTESTPQLANEVYQSIMKNYYDIAEPLLGDVILTSLIDSTIPTKADKAFSPYDGMLKTFIIALIATLVFLCVLSYLKDTIRREEDIEEKLDATLLGTLAHEKKYKKGFGKKVEEQKTILVSDPMVSFRYSESVKKLASKIATKMDRRKVKTVLVTSVMENEGKSTVAANIALALSKRSNKVLLIDGDFRKPAIYKIFDVDPDEIENFGEVLNGKADMSHLICHRDDVNLSMILNSVRYPDSTDMIAQDLMTKVIHLLEQQFDYIIIDSSPMALVADTQEWMDIIDAAVLVVRQNSSSVRDINDAISMLNRDSIKLLGCIFNNVEGNRDKFENRGYGRYGKYGKYGKYGNYGQDSHADREAYSDYSTYSDYSRKTDDAEDDPEIYADGPEDEIADAVGAETAEQPADGAEAEAAEQYTDVAEAEAAEQYADVAEDEAAEQYADEAKTEAAASAESVDLSSADPKESASADQAAGIDSEEAAHTFSENKKGEDEAI